VLQKVKTLRNEKYKAYIRTLPCCLCGANQDIQAHHTESGGMALKGSDYSTVPECPRCHERMDTKRGIGVFADGELNRVIIRCLIGYVERLR